MGLYSVDLEIETQLLFINGKLYPLPEARSSFSGPFKTRRVQGSVSRKVYSWEPLAANALLPTLFSKRSSALGSKGNLRLIQGLSKNRGDVSAWCTSLHLLSWE